MVLCLVFIFVVSLWCLSLSFLNHKSLMRTPMMHCVHCVMHICGVIYLVLIFVVSFNSDGNLFNFGNLP